MGEIGKRSQSCPICLSPTLSTHFGIVSCRACAAFYRRAVVDKKVFHCRQSAACSNFTNIRHSCKKCRFDRCIQHGMKKEAIIQKQKPSLESETEHQKIPIFIPSPSPCSSSTPLLIKNLVEKYRLLCSVRKATEFALKPNRDFSTRKGLEGLSFGSSSTMSLFFRAHVPSFVHFISTSFPELSLLTEDEKWQLLQPFFVYFWWLDAAYRTYRMVPKEQFTQLCIMSETTFFEKDQIDDWVSDMILNDQATIPVVKQFILKRYEPDQQRFLYYISSMKLTEEEYVCLIGLLFWNTAILQNPGTKNMASVIKVVRKSLYQSLEELYCNLGDSWTVRYGELLNLISLFVIECLRCKEELGMQYSLDAFRKEDFFYEMEACWEQKAIPSSPLS